MQHAACIHQDPAKTYALYQEIFGVEGLRRKLLLNGRLRKHPRDHSWEVNFPQDLTSDRTA